MSNENKQPDERAECAHDYVRTDGVCTECGGSATITCSSKHCPQPARPDVRAASVTASMTLAERIAHVGGRENAAGYIEFGSVMAVNALIQGVLRDMVIAPAAKAPITRDAFYQALRAALKKYRRANPPRYLNDEQADASDDDFASSMADHHAGVIKQ